MTGAPTLARRLSLLDAVAIGLGSMIGAGVFAVFSPAAASAGGWLLVGLVIAALVAFCNATSSAQLAAQYPTSGGTYVYGRERLGPWPGFLAGWCFVIGKIASCAAMAMTFAHYVAPEGWATPIAIAAVVALAAINYTGVTRTATATTVIVVVVLAVLAVVLVLGFSGPAAAEPALVSGTPHLYGILQSAGLLFFAFAGYARIATLGEEVAEPRRTIPRAIVTSLAVVLVLYAALAAMLLLRLGPDALAASSAPLLDAVAEAWWAAPVVRLGAAFAALGALLALIAGIGRTSLAMARENDLPRWLSAVHPRFRTPHRAEVVVAVVIVAVIAVADLRGAIGFSSFGVLLYYFVANVSAFTQTAEHRRYPRALQTFGALACLALVATLPWRSVLVGLVVLAVGVAVRVALTAGRATPRA